MTAALDRDYIITCLENIAEVTARLHDKYGVTTTWTTTTELGEWDGHTRTVQLNIDSPLDDQAWVLSQIWDLCTIGRHAVPAAQTRRHLRPV